MNITIANVLRFIAIAEIFFSIGFLGIRWWKRDGRLHYLSLMVIALVLYSLYAAGTMVARYNLPLSWWRTPLVFIAATVAIVAVIREGWPKGGGKVNN